MLMWAHATHDGSMGGFHPEHLTTARKSHTPREIISVTATNGRAFRKRRQRKDELKQLRQDHTKLLRILASAGEMTHDNHVYARGWHECLKYIQAGVKKPSPRIPGGEHARQSSFMRPSDALKEKTT